MAATNTTRVEGLDFVATDKTTPVVSKMETAFTKFSGITDKIQGKLKGFGKNAALGLLGGAGIAWGLHGLARTIKEASFELEEAEERIAGAAFAFEAWKPGMSALDKYRGHAEMATEVVDKLAASEDRLKVGRGELAKTYAASSQLAQRHRLDQEGQLEFTEKLAAAQKVLGVSAEMAAANITRATIMGVVSGTDKLSLMLQGAITDRKKFREMSESARFSAIKEAMGNLVPAAEEMGKRWTGAWFDIKNITAQIVRDLTQPVFKEIAKSTREFAKHITQVREDGKTLMFSYGEKLVKAFHAVQSASKWIAAHWKEILAIWASSKFVGMARGWQTSLAGMAAGGALGGAGLASGAAGVSAGFMGVAAKANLVVGALLVFKMGLDAAAGAVARMQDESLRVQAAGPRTQSALLSGSKAYRSAMAEQSVEKTFGHLKSAFAAYGLKPGQELPRKTIAAELKGMSADLAAKYVSMYGIKGATPEVVKKAGFIDEASGRIATALTGLAKSLMESFPDLGKKRALTPPSQVTNHFHGGVHITQEFKEPDPERIFHRVVREINDVAMNPRDSSVGMLAMHPERLG